MSEKKKQYGSLSPQQNTCAVGILSVNCIYKHYCW